MSDYRKDETASWDTRQVREILEGIPLDTPEVSAYIEDFLKENTREADRDVRL